MHYHLHNISLNRGGSYIDSPKWLKKAAINPKNNDHKCFQYAIIVVLNHQNIKNNPERITRIKPFIDQCNKNQLLLISYIYISHNNEEIKHAYLSKLNTNNENHVILVMITAS